MDSGSWLLIAIIVFFLFMAAFFAAAESSFTSMNKIRMKSLSDDGDRKAKKAMFISGISDKALTAILIGNNIAHIAAASVATLLFTHLWENGSFGSASEATVNLLGTILITFIVFLFCEMIPKSFATDCSNRIARASASPLLFSIRLFTPLVAFFGLITKGFSKLFRAEESPSFTEDELYDIIDTAEEEGAVDEDQGDLLKSALDFTVTTAASIMTMRQDIVAIDDEMSNEEIVALIKSTSHSRFPVYHKTLDSVIGIIQIRTFLREYMNNRDVDIHSLLLEPFFVGEHAVIDDILSSMRQKACYQAIVTDEVGSVVGLVTIEDFLEELVGEIWDEEDVVDDRFMNLGGNRYRVDTHLTVGEAFERMGLECPDARFTSRPVLSWLIEILGSVPDDETSFIYKNLEITSDDEHEGDKVTHVFLRILTEESEQEGGEGLHE